MSLDIKNMSIEELKRCLNSLSTNPMWDIDLMAAISLEIDKRHEEGN